MKSLEDITLKKTRTYIQTGKDGINKQVNNAYKQKLVVKSIDPGLRFVHLLVDYFVIYLIIFILSATISLNDTEASFLNLFVFFGYFLSYIILEYNYQQTLGKMITNHVVINKYVQKPDLRTCILRTLIRFVPFEAFSCMTKPSRGWHDKWTDTYVVHKDEVAKLKMLLEKNHEEEEVGEINF